MPQLGVSVADAFTDEQTGRCSSDAKGDDTPHFVSVNLAENSFLAVSAAIGSLAEISESYEAGAGHPQAVVNVAIERCKRCTDLLISVARSASWFKNCFSFSAYVLDLNGAGLGAAMRQTEEAVDVYTLLPDLVATLESGFEKWLHARLDVCVISIFLDDHPPSFIQLENGGDVSRWCEALGCGIELYSYRSDSNLVVLRSWSDHGIPDEGQLVDSNDGDGKFRPEWHQVLGSITVKRSAT